MIDSSRIKIKECRLSTVEFSHEKPEFTLKASLRQEMEMDS